MSTWTRMMIATNTTEGLLIQKCHRTKIRMHPKHFVVKQLEWRNFPIRKIYQEDRTKAGDILASSYVKIRDDVRRRAIESAARNEGGEGGADQAVIPITVRQLEALIRLSESLSKMRLEDEVQGQDIAEALRLFKVSTHK